ncbi:MAG: hypothetical protein BGO77_00470 [Caedibacter sp. 37-49]|nr:MAG: hypothetical protein BGO77_00470 [Caedibacter sp. 37-49]
MIPRARVYKGGKIVIPAFLRKKLNLKEGEEVIFDIQGNSLVMTSLKHTLHKARQTIKRYHVTDQDSGESLTANQKEVMNNES